MGHSKHIEERLKEPENSIEHWREQVAEYGVEYVRKLLDGPVPVSAVWPISAQQAIEEAEKAQYKQQLSESTKRDAREEETLELAREANRISRRSRKEMRYTWAATVIIGVLTIINMILLAQGGGTS